MNKFIDCKGYADFILKNISKIENKKKLVIISVGENAASESYVKGKLKDCSICGIEAIHEKYTENDQAKVENDILKYNADNSVGGIIVQLPLPNGWDEEYFTNLVDDLKDVDGFKITSNFDPCTPLGIMVLLFREFKSLKGKTALVIGRGKLVGKPIREMLIDEDCTVTVAHSKTPKEVLIKHLKESDIIISAVGKPHLFDESLCNNSFIVDCGVSKVNGKLCGDFKVSELDNGNKITPVPGGVGLLTRAMLMCNVAFTNELAELE